MLFVGPHGLGPFTHATDPQYHGSTFKVALFDQWLVVVCGSNMVDELMRRPDSEVSFLEGIEEV